jgi:hypothetical protein
MAGLNKVMIIGNLGADPEMKYMADGTAMTSFVSRPVGPITALTANAGKRPSGSPWLPGAN